MIVINIIGCIIAILGLAYVLKLDYELKDKYHIAFQFCMLYTLLFHCVDTFKNGYNTSTLFLWIGLFLYFLTRYKKHNENTRNVS